MRGVLPGPRLRLRWDGGVTNYTQVLAAAIDEAGGHAFATEFAAKSASVEVKTAPITFATDRTALYGRTVTRDDGQALGQDVATSADVSKSAWREGALFPTSVLDISGLATTAGNAGALASWLRAFRLPWDASFPWLSGRTRKECFRFYYPKPSLLR